MPKPRRVIRITASLILTMFLMTTVACAPPSVPDEPGAQDVTLADQDVTVTSALQNAADYDKLYATIKRIAAGAKSISDVYSGATGAFNAIVAILRLAGIINPAPDTIGVLTAEIDALGVSLSWQRAASDRDLDMAWMVTALDTIENNTGPPLTNQSTVIANSLTAVNNAEGLAAGSPFLRSFAEASTDGIINWKGVVQNRPTAASNPTVYDWRMGVPILMKLIALRLVVIGAVDPNFRTDHVYDTEMERHRNVLLDQMRTMLDGSAATSTTTSSRPSPWAVCPRPRSPGGATSPAPTSIRASRASFSSTPPGRSWTGGARPPRGRRSSSTSATR